jgi:hypothetical protein
MIKYTFNFIIQKYSLICLLAGMIVMEDVLTQLLLVGDTVFLVEGSVIF